MRGAVADIDEILEQEKRPLSTVDELPGYRWSDKKQDTPIKENDHGLDELRYVVAYVDNVGAKTAQITTSAQIDNYAMRPDKQEDDRPGF